MADHICTFQEVLIEESDEEGPLRVGMKVLAPCAECGEEPMAHVEFLEHRAEELSTALLAVEPHKALYHWSPFVRRQQILRYGLLPGKRPTTTQGDDRKIPYVCLADSPSWAWALSGQQRHTPVGTWDLWMTWLNKVVEPIVHATPDRPSGLDEVRTEHRIYKRDLWWIGSRLKS